MAKQSYDKKIAIKRSGRRSVRTRTCNKGTDAHAKRINQNKSNRNIDIDKGTAAKQIDFKKQSKQKGTAAAIKRTPLLLTKEQSTGSSKQNWSNPTESIYKTHRGALEIEIFEPPVDCCKYTPKKYKKTGKVYGKTTNPSAIPRVY